MSTFSLELIRKKLTYFPKPSGIKFPKHPSLVQCTLSDIMNWVYDETAALFEKNRGRIDGTNTVAETTAKSIRTNLCTNAISNFVMCLNDGTLPEYAIPSNGACAVLADGNSTVKGLFDRLISGLSNDSEMQELVVLRVCNGYEFHEIYNARNVQSPHSITQILSSSHHVHRGAMDKFIFKHMSDDNYIHITGKPVKRLTYLSYILENWRTLDRDDNMKCFMDCLFRKKSSFKENRRYEVGKIDFGLSEENGKAIAEGVEFYCDWIKKTKSLITDAKAFRSIAHSGPMLGIIVCDYICNDHLIIPKRNPVVTLANRTARNFSDMCMFVPIITASKQNSSHSTILKIIKTLKRKS
ncbi:MAG: hypothetical protein WC057_02230 [Dehalococcoidales bacterium]